MFETKILLDKPEKWDGSKKAWKHWAHRVRGNVRGVSVKLSEMMKIAAKIRDPIVSHDGWEDEQIALDARLYIILTGMVQGDAMDWLMNTEEGFGCEVWRQFSKDNEPKTVGHLRNSLALILDPALVPLTGPFMVKCASSRRCAATTSPSRAARFPKTSGWACCSTRSLRWACARGWSPTPSASPATGR